MLVGLFAFAVFDGFFPPLPSETAIVALASTWASSGKPELAAVVVVAAAGAFAGDQLVYATGRRLERSRLGRWRAVQAVVRSGRSMAARGGTALLAARFVPGGRAAVAASAGASSYPYQRYLLWTAGGAVLWASYYSFIGAVAGMWLSDRPVVAVIVGIVCGSGIGLFTERVIRRRQAARSAETVSVSNVKPVRRRCSATAQGNGESTSAGGRRASAR